MKPRATHTLGKIATTEQHSIHSNSRLLITCLLFKMYTQFLTSLFYVYISKVLIFFSFYFFGFILFLSYYWQFYNLALQTCLANLFLFNSNINSHIVVFENPVVPFADPEDFQLCLLISLWILLFFCWKLRSLKLVYDNILRSGIEFSYDPQELDLVVFRI